MELETEQIGSVIKQDSISSLTIFNENHKNQYFRKQMHHVAFKGKTPNKQGNMISIILIFDSEALCIDNCFTSARHGVNYSVNDGI